MSAKVRTLSEAERNLLRETEPARLAELDEDALLDLHARVRRARTKYVTLHRRAASARVGTKRARGTAEPLDARDARKAEVFEEALARVSRRVAVEARYAANELKAERLAAARRQKTPIRSAKPVAKPVAKPSGTGRTRAHRKTTGGRKRDASTLAKGSRRQAARDGRSGS